jgi:epoxyqueuosine reductase
MTASADINLSGLIKQKAWEQGFHLCGVAPSKILIEHMPVLKNWCSSGLSGDMNYLCRDIEKRINPAFIVPEAKSVIVTGLNYFSFKQQEAEKVPLISRYAYGADYHDVIKEKLDNILNYIQILNPETEGKSFVDSAPILEKAWAYQAGLGRPGRHSVLINKKLGSFFFIGIIILNTGLEYDEPVNEDFCKNCRLCIDSCPTRAINEDRTIDARKCISYHTIESKKPIPEEMAGRFGGRVFGCDKCQEVCPWNHNAKPHNVAEFELSEELAKMSSDDWTGLSPERFNRLFSNSAIKRRGYSRFMENVTIVTKFKN